LTNQTDQSKQTSSSLKEAANDEKQQNTEVANGEQEVA